MKCCLSWWALRLVLMTGCNVWCCYSHQGITQTGLSSAGLQRLAGLLSNCFDANWRLSCGLDNLARSRFFDSIFPATCSVWLRQTGSFWFVLRLIIQEFIIDRLSSYIVLMALMLMVCLVIQMASVDGMVGVDVLMNWDSKFLLLDINTTYCIVISSV